MYTHILYGEHLFVVKDDVLTLDINPHIPLSLFKNGIIEAELFQKPVVFHNEANSDYDSQKVSYYEIDGVRYEKIADTLAIKIRNKDFDRLDIFLA